jgi:hypothetical protein
MNELSCSYKNRSSYPTDLQSKFYFSFTKVGALSTRSPAIFVPGLPKILAQISSDDSKIFQKKKLEKVNRS